ncbi:Uma2 family endonuclease [Chloroflexi bacterium TSY]|nr:Uma2 family endonuclease [Chloroflexi bacterium TSY]
MLDAAAIDIPQVKPPPSSDELPFEDGIPMASPKHRMRMNILIEDTHRHWYDRNDYYVGGNMFVYFSESQILHKTYRGPDFFIVKDVDGSKNRKSWVIWEEEGRYPDLIVELRSETTAQVDKTVKKNLYERTFRTLEYFCYDVEIAELIGWRLGTTGNYEKIQANENDHLWSETLQLWLGTWEGILQKRNNTWLRFFDETDNLISTKEEAEAARAEQEANRAEWAESELEQLRAELARLKGEKRQ